MLLVFLVLVGFASAEVNLPHGHELKAMLDQMFNLLDKNADGGLSYSELASLAAGEDVNHDGQVTFAEYVAYWHLPADDMRPVFNAYDTDMDGVIPMDFLQQYFHLLDPNDDGVSTPHEYEHYMTGFLQCVFNAHGNHGHGHDCHV